MRNERTSDVEVIFIEMGCALLAGFIVIAIALGYRQSQSKAELVGLELITEMVTLEATEIIDEATSEKDAEPEDIYSHLNITNRVAAETVYSYREFSYLCEAMEEYCKIWEDDSLIYTISETPKITPEGYTSIDIEVSNGYTVQFLLDKTYDEWAWYLVLDDN